MCEARERNGRSDGYAIGMECEGSARMEEGMRNPRLVTYLNTTFTQSRWRLRNNNSASIYPNRTNMCIQRISNYWYDTTKFTNSIHLDSKFSNNFVLSSESSIENLGYISRLHLATQKENLPQYYLLQGYPAYPIRSSHLQPVPA